MNVLKDLNKFANNNKVAATVTMILVLNMITEYNILLINHLFIFHIT